jgi:hypothetical protein
MAVVTRAFENRLDLARRWHCEIDRRIASIDRHQLQQKKDASGAPKPLHSIPDVQHRARG